MEKERTKSRQAIRAFRFVFLVGVMGLFGCSSVPLFSGKNYYRMIETRSSNQRVGENALETREVFCPAGRISDSDNPSIWTDMELHQRLVDKVCLRVICHTDPRSDTKCQSLGDEKLKSELEKMREQIQNIE